MSWLDTAIPAALGIYILFLAIIGIEYITDKKERAEPEETEVSFKQISDYHPPPRKQKKRKRKAAAQREPKESIQEKAVGKMAALVSEFPKKKGEKKIEKPKPKTKPELPPKLEKKSKKEPKKSQWGKWRREDLE